MFSVLYLIYNYISSIIKKSWKYWDFFAVTGRVIYDLYQYKRNNRDRYYDIWKKRWKSRKNRKDEADSLALAIYPRLSPFTLTSDETMGQQLQDAITRRINSRLISKKLHPLVLSTIGSRSQLYVVVHIPCEWVSRLLSVCVCALERARTRVCTRTCFRT